ncbi:hypothetical protein Tco_0445234 [Tanacetum coccineum]
MGNNNKIALARSRIANIEQIIEDIQYKGKLMPPKRTSTSEASAMTQASIKKLVVDSVSAALEAQAANMAGNGYPTKGRKIKQKRTKPSTEWKSVEKTKSNRSHNQSQKSKLLHQVLLEPLMLFQHLSQFVLHLDPLILLLLVQVLLLNGS